VARRRSSYRSLGSLQRDNAVCRACAEAGYPLESLPVFEGRTGQRAMIVGQAPGVVEGAERRPWRGRAGQTLRRWLGLDEETFYDVFYCVSVTRCYPGKHPSGRGARPATPRELDLCRFWLDWELRLLRPELILSVGGLATRRLLGLSRLTECVGRRYQLGGATVVPLPHPSGASGWLNEPANRNRLERALGLVRDALSSLSEPSVGRAGGGAAGGRTRAMRTSQPRRPSPRP
jgi:uracil-DNA glycosylase